MLLAHARKNVKCPELAVDYYQVWGTEKQLTVLKERVLGLGGKVDGISICTGQQLRTVVHIELLPWVAALFRGPPAHVLPI